MGNEITLKINCSIKEFENILKNKDFSFTGKFNLDDIYYIKQDVKVNKDIIKDVMANYILIRRITQFKPHDFIDSEEIIKLTIKQKEINSNGEIVKQTKKDCEILNIEQGKEFIKALGYKELVRIKEDSVVYEKDGLGIAIKDVKGEDTLIEVETVEGNSELDTVKKLKQKIDEFDLPVDKSNYFVKKVEMKLV